MKMMKPKDYNLLFIIIYTFLHLSFHVISINEYWKCYSKVHRNKMIIHLNEDQIDTKDAIEIQLKMLRNKMHSMQFQEKYMCNLKANQMHSIPYIVYRNMKNGNGINYIYSIKCNRIL